MLLIHSLNRTQQQQLTDQTSLLNQQQLNINENGNSFVEMYRVFSIREKFIRFRN
jgi:hypothetical protein